MDALPGWRIRATAVIGQFDAELSPGILMLLSQHADHA